MTHLPNNIHSFIFLDFEACSLSLNGWPIEIGMSGIGKDGNLITKGSLIKPHPTWDLDEWSNQSEKIHKLSLKFIQSHGMNAEDVSAWAANFLEGKTLVSDNPQYEHRWLRKLLDICDIGNDMDIIHIKDMFASSLSDEGFDEAAEYLSRHKAPHCARDDAERLAKAWKKGLDITHA